MSGVLLEPRGGQLWLPSGELWTPPDNAEGIALDRIVPRICLVPDTANELDTLEPTADRMEFSRKRLVGLPVQVWKIESLDFVPARPVDFLWLDSRMDLRVPEFEHFRAWTRPGTIAGFHDTAPHQDDQWGEAIDAIPGIRPIRLRTPRGVTFVEVL